MPALQTISRSRDALEAMVPGFQQTYDVFRFCGPDDLVLDVGAHWGYSAVAMRHNGCAARILSVEAMPGNTPALQRLKEIDPAYNFVNAAASDVAGQLRFYIPTIDLKLIGGLATTGGTLENYFARTLARIAEGMRTATSHPLHVGVAIIEVPAMPIDDLPAIPGAQVAAIKLDVEGHEAAAVRGARRLLAAQRPLIMIEGANRNGDVVNELTSLGYEHFDRIGSVLVPQMARSLQNDGFWVHRDRVTGYADLGLVAAP